VIPDPYREGVAAPELNAPDGFYAPVRGFGLVWESLGAAAGPLGWATEPEQGFDSARQSAGVQSYTTYVRGPDARVYALTRIPQIDFGMWTQVND
jgi:hypothetical protein